MQTTFNQSENPWQLGATGGRIARWFFGFGFFCVSLGVYLITGMTLLTINLLRDPGDLWVGGPLFRWGMLVFVHFLGAVVCWAVTTAMDAARTTRAETDARIAAAPIMPPLPMPVPVAAQTDPAPQGPPRPRFQPAPSTPADGVTDDDKGRFGFRSWRGETPYSEARPRTSPPGWTVMGPGVTPAAAPPRTPAPSLPESAPPTTESLKEGAALLGEPVISVAPVEGDQRWTWVEAAAEAWLANRAVAEPPKVDEPRLVEPDSDAVIEAPLPESPTPEEPADARRRLGRD
jgi:hypothetical protein